MRSRHSCEQDRQRYFVPTNLPPPGSPPAVRLARNNRDRAERKLPPTGWTWKESVEEGRWSAPEPEPVDVPAAYALMNEVWYRVQQGVRGLLVRTRAGEPVVYLICEPSTRYYRVMTRADWMPTLIDEVI